MSDLSIAMIVRDEAVHLPECYDAFRDLDAEWIVIDTGSQDATPTIAKSFAHVFDTFDWCDDFSAARNAALERCTRNWILVIDADERMNASGIDWIRETSAHDPAIAYRFMTKNYTDSRLLSGFVEDDGQFAGWYPSYKVRLFPNRADIRFRGVVHELVEPAIEAANIPMRDALKPVLHYPESRSSEARKDKQSMYLRLGGKKLELEPDSAQAYFEFGNQCAEIGAYAEAAGALRRAVEIDNHFAAAWKDLGAMLHLLDRNADAEGALRIAIRIDENMAEAWRNLAVVLSSMQRHDEALAAIDAASLLAPHWKEADRFRSIIRSRMTQQND